ncbi:MAG: ParB N-terminal domain-containing protein [Trichloromonadaceae bacterium]
MSQRRAGTSINWLEIQGAFGDFCAPGSESPVSYLLTHASLGSDGSGFSQLTKQLVPVRELFDIGDLNFDELLQRDLDDHRVASEIIPYLLKSGPSARFFPPILAVIMPVEAQNALDYYPPKTQCSVPEKSSDGTETGYIEETTSYGRVFEIVRFRDRSGEYSHETRIRLNPDQAKIVVLDGQHRAMAILAIRRSQTGEWGDKGADFKHFYEDISVGLKDKNILKSLASVELPVCLAFLPELYEKETPPPITLTQSFRKLFLDVNKEARTPTRARQLLLDDSNIISVLTRALLSAVRDQGQLEGTTSYSIDLDSFEYDSPRESPKPQRDLALCTIEMLYELVRWTNFAEDEYYLKPMKMPSTGRPYIKFNRFLDEIRADETIPNDLIDSWGFSDLENELVASDTPTICHQKLAELFMTVWGKPIVTFLSTLHPMHAHVKAVADLRASHLSETGFGKLAWRALFDGQGVYWTIKNYTEHRRAEANSRGIDLPITDVEKAYEAITQTWIPKEFEVSRAKHYWNLGNNAPSTEQLAIAKYSFQIYRTMAFQIGFLMAIALLKKSLGLKDPLKFEKAVAGWIFAWNQAFTQLHKGEKSRRSLSMFDERGDGLMARHFRRLQKSDWIWFRYFSFEMLHAVAADVDFEGKEVVEKSLNEMRLKYIQTLGAKLRSDHKKQGVSVTDENANEKAAVIWSGALHHSLGLTKKDFNAWWKEFGKPGKLPLDNGDSEPFVDIDQDVSDFEDTSDSEKI